MVKLGNFFFKYRNLLFPVFYALLFVPTLPILADWRIAVVIGVLITLLGQLVRMVTIGLDYIVRGGRNKQVFAEGLVTQGLFKHCRNPMYVGNVLMILGMSVVANNLLFLLIMVPLFFFIYQCIIRAEEHYLHAKFGEEFDAYTARVPRWGIRFAGLGATLRAASFNYKRVLLKEYNSTAVWLGATVLLVAVHIYRNEGSYMLQDHSFALYVAAGLVLLSYLLIRYLKKSGMVRS